jgi:hypothetical protein
LLHVVLAVICFLVVKYLFIYSFFFTIWLLENMNLGIKNLKKIKIKKEKEKLIESQKGALEKFVTSNKQNITEKLGDSSKNE